MSQTLDTDYEAKAEPLGRNPERLAFVTGKAEGRNDRRRRARGLVASAHLALEQRQTFVLMPFAVILGLIGSLEASVAPNPITLVGVWVLLAIALPLCWRSLATLRLVALFGAFWLGFSLFAVYGALFGTGMLARPAYGTYQARIDRIVSATPSGRRVVVSEIVAVPPARALGVRRARVLIKAGPELGPGDIITGPIWFYPVPGPVLPGHYDSQFHAYFNGVGAYGSATKPVRLVRAGAQFAPLRLIGELREGIGARIDAVLDAPSAGIARALITGDQSGVTEAARKTMATAGLAHVLSISGLHLSLVAGGIFFVLRALFALVPGIWRRVSSKKLAAIGGIVAALAYFAISGSNVAALRSMIMLVLVFGAVLAGRRALTMRNVAIAALICILIEPANVFRPSFQLSFAAVVGLIGVYELLGRRGVVAGKWWGRFVTHFVGIACTSLIAGAATVLFAIYHFQQTSPLGILGNLAALPLVGFVMMPSAVLAVLAMPFGAERPFLGVMGWSIDRMLDVAGVVAHWSAPFNAAPLLTPLALFIGLLALGWFSFFTNRYRLIGPALVVPLVMAFALDRPPDVLVADTTQALAIRTPLGLELVAGKRKSFAVKVWQQTFREPIPQAGAPLTRCDSIGCVSKSPLGFTVAQTKDYAGFAQDCARTDLVVTHLRAPPLCRAETTVIDATDLGRGGVQWLSWDKGRHRFTVRPAITDLNRAWRAGPH